VFCENSEVKMMNRTNKRKGKQKWDLKKIKWKRHWIHCSVQ
jgi:hypothetical protein